MRLNRSMLRIGAGFVCLFVPLLAWARPRLDQEQVSLDTGVVLALGGHSEQKLAQVFTPSRDAFISHFTLEKGCVHTSNAFASLVRNSLPSHTFPRQQIQIGALAI
jgi:hypothetical protein